MSLKRTCLYDLHVQDSAKLVPFAGFEMPISYDATTGGMKAEHFAVREKSGIFDVSHMGEFWLEGPQAAAFLDYACTRNYSGAKEGRAQYSLLLNERGGIVDDIIVYKFSDQKFWMVVNAANIDKDFQHLDRLKKDFQVKLTDVSEKTALVALQGPEAEKIIGELDSELTQLKYYSFATSNKNWLVGRTGYTGEDGFEIFLPVEEAPDLWKTLRELGALPIGLGARDSLRMEVGFPLYGQELTDDLYPQETFSGFAVRNEADFFSKKFTEMPARYLPIGLLGQNPKPLRHGDKLFVGSEEVGEVTSGSFSPALKLGMGLGLIRLNSAASSLDEGDNFVLESAGKRRECIWTNPAFVETARTKMRKPVAKK